MSEKVPTRPLIVYCRTVILMSKHSQSRSKWTLVQKSTHSISCESVGDFVVRVRDPRSRTVGGCNASRRRCSRRSPGFRNPVTVITIIANLFPRTLSRVFRYSKKVSSYNMSDHENDANSADGMSKWGKNGFGAPVAAKQSGKFSKDESETVRKAIAEFCSTRDISIARLCSECDHKAELKGAWMEISKCLPERSVQSVYRHGIRKVCICLVRFVLPFCERHLTNATAAPLSTRGLDRRRNYSTL